VRLDPFRDVLETSRVPADAAALKEAYERLQFIYGLGKTICSTRTLEDLAATVITGLTALVGCERCLLAEVRGERDLEPLAVHNLPALGRGPAGWPLSTTVLSRAIADGQAILSADAMRDDRFDASGSIRNQKIKSVLCVPFGSREHIQGVLYADSRLTSGRFSETDLVFATALGHYVSLGYALACERKNAQSAQDLSTERWTLLQDELLSQHRFVGRSPNLLKAYDRAKRLARRDLPILIQGESGTGKELFAEAIHRQSRRASAPLIPVNVASFSDSLIESELFGHEKGAFTGATVMRKGRFELADGGTLFLDEVAEIPLHVQAKLLRAIEGGFERVGGTTTLRPDVRLICATLKDLESEVRSGSFRPDLYYRLAGAKVFIPPLRERPNDIAALVQGALTRVNSSKTLTGPALDVLRRYSWPGNVRQLLRVVEELDAIVEEDRVGPEDLPGYLFQIDTPREDAHPSFDSLAGVVAQAERDHFRRALEIGGSHERAITLLGISRGKYFERRRKFGL
jgi:transcriptional regulator with GAF, ATPase, and Fis domain